jgi:cell division protein ZapB
MMDLIDQIEERMERLLQRIRQLEEENSRLRTSLDTERQIKDDVLTRLDHLLKKIQEVDI